MTVQRISVRWTSMEFYLPPVLNVFPPVSSWPRQWQAKISRLRGICSYRMGGLRYKPITRRSLVYLELATVADGPTEGGVLGSTHTSLNGDLFPWIGL